MNSSLVNKKYLGILVIIIILIIAIIPSNKSENLRIRVIGNSDSSEDLNVKYTCVSIIKKYVKSDFTKEEVIEVLPKINSEIQNYCKSKNKNVSVGITKTVFPPKTLNGRIIDGGEYETLLVKIGEAKGSNFWTLLYPEYFDITFDDIYSGEVEVKWFILELFK